MSSVRTPISRSGRERDPFLGDLGEVTVVAIGSLERLLELLPAQAEQLDVADSADRGRPSRSARMPTSPKNCPRPSVASLTSLPSGLRRLIVTSPLRDDVEAVGGSPSATIVSPGANDTLSPRSAERVELRPTRSGNTFPSQSSSLVRVALPGRPVGRAQRPGAKGAQDPQHLVHAAADIVRVDAHVHSTPFGSMMKVPRCAAPSSSSTPKERLSSRRLSAITG